MKVGDLVQVLPARIGYYIILSVVQTPHSHGGRAVYYNLAPVAGANFDHGGPMNEKFIEVASESR